MTHTFSRNKRSGLVTSETRKDIPTHGDIVHQPVSSLSLDKEVFQAQGPFPLASGGRKTAMQKTAFPNSLNTGEEKTSYVFIFGLKCYEKQMYNA